MAKYKWKDESIAKANGFEKVDPQEAGKRLRKLSQTKDGLSPEVVVEDARDESSPLHNAFTWDDTEAARKCRLNEARQLVRCISVTVVDQDDDPVTVRAFVSVRQEQALRYVPIDKAREDEEMWKKVMARLLGDIKAYKRKFAELEAISAYGSVMTSLDDFESKVRRFYNPKDGEQRPNA